MIYNVKTIEYLDSVQIRTYKRPVQTNPKLTTTKQKINNRKRADYERTKKQIDHSVKSSVNRTVNQIYAISRSNRWEYFVTLTIDPNKLDSTDFNLISEKLNIWTNNLKKRYAPDLKYILVPELHKDKKKWHFHGLFANIGSMPLTFSGKTCIGKFVYDYVKKPYATKVYNIPLWKYGYSTATIVKDTAKASSYITKYITKDVSRVLANQHRYLASQNNDRPVERVFNVDYDTLAKIYSKHLPDVSYISDVEVPHAHQEIIYMEFNRESTNEPLQGEIHFNPFEAKHDPVDVPDNEIMKKRAMEHKKEFTLPRSGHTLTGKEHLANLRKLKQYLKDNPEQKKNYSDLNIDLLILQTKRKMMERKEKEHEQTRLYTDGFRFTDENPFY